MCGFVVAVDIDGLSDDKWLSSFESLASRGPDASGEAFVGSARFGHKRLSIIGLGSEGKQPIDDGKDILVFNGEIYNYRELARQLGVEAESDTQVLFEMIKRDLREWLPKIRGMYAFVHFNIASGRISAARDPFGIKPLYFRTHGSGGLSLGSTVACLANLSRQPAVDPVAVANFLAWGFIPAGRSIFESIHKLSPGKLAVWKRADNQYGSPTYWDIPMDSWPELPLSEALRDSVDAHLVSDVEIGVFLSGGVDSTLIASYARDELSHLRTFTLSNPLTPEIDESNYARANARILGTEHIEVSVTPELLVEQTHRIITTSGEPFSDAAFLPLAVLSQAARQHVKVCLAGEGADELFAGYRRYDVESRFQNPVYGRPLRRFISDSRISAYLEERNVNWARITQAAATTSPLEQHAALMYASWSTVIAALGEPARQAWIEQVKSWDNQKGLNWSLGLPRNREFDLRTWLPNVFLEKSDRAPMAHSLEVRVPFLDPVVATAARNYTPKNSLKAPLRDLLQQRLPRVQLPPLKKGLAVNLGGVLPHFTEEINFILYSQHSMLHQQARTDSDLLKRESLASPTLNFRLAILGLWQQLWIS